MVEFNMYQEPIYLTPVFQERIWGGDKIKTLFGYGIPNDLTGEAWVISAHKNGPSTIINGPLQGQILAQAWSEQRTAKKSGLWFKQVVDQNSLCE